MLLACEIWWHSVEGFKSYSSLFIYKMAVAAILDFVKMLDLIKFSKSASPMRVHHRCYFPVKYGDNRLLLLLLLLKRNFQCGLNNNCYCEVHERRYYKMMSGNDLRKRNVLSLERKTGNDGANWTSAGRVFQRVDAATWKERRPMVASRWTGMTRRPDVEERSWRRPGRSATRWRPDRYDGGCPWRELYAITASL